MEPKASGARIPLPLVVSSASICIVGRSRAGFPLPGGSQMLSQASAVRNPAELPTWPEPGLTRVPYWLFQDPHVYAAEQRRLFQGPQWSFLCLAVEVPNAGDFCTTAVGEASVIVTRDGDGELYAFENRCAHRGALIALEPRGNAK